MRAHTEAEFIEQALLYRAGQKTAPIMFGKFRRMPLNEEEDACVERMCGPDTLRIFYSNSNGLAEELLEYYVGAAETVDCTMIAEGNKDHGYYAENFPEHARVIVENIGVTGILPVAQAALLLKEANKCVSSSSSNIPIFHNSVFMKTDVRKLVNLEIL